MSKNIGDGSLGALNDFIDLTGLDAFSTCGIVLSGTWSGTITIYGSLDGSTLSVIVCQALGGGSLTGTINTNGQYVMNCAGMSLIRVKMTSYTSGTANITAWGSNSFLFSRSVSVMAGGTDATIIGNDGNRMLVQIEALRSYQRCTGNATTTIKSGSGRCYGLSIGDNTTGGTITLYDNTAGSGTVIAKFFVGTPLSLTGFLGAHFLPLEINFTTGLTAVTAGSTANDFTVVYR